MLGVAHEELCEEHAAGGGHIGGEEEGDLRRVDAEYAPLELLLGLGLGLGSGLGLGLGLGLELGLGLCAA